MASYGAGGRSLRSCINSRSCLIAEPLLVRQIKLKTRPLVSAPGRSGGLLFAAALLQCPAMRRHAVSINLLIGRPRRRRFLQGAHTDRLILRQIAFCCVGLDPARRGASRQQTSPENRQQQSRAHHSDPPPNLTIYSTHHAPRTARTFALGLSPESARPRRVRPLAVFARRPMPISLSAVPRE